jgi:hypothetical protein
MTDEAEYEEYRNTLNEIVDGGGCVETMGAAAELRDGSPSRRDLLGSDALTAGVAESVDDVLAEVDTDDARAALRADYEDLDDVRAAFESTVDPALFDAVGAAGVDLSGVGAMALNPAVCLKTFTEADLPAAMTLVPHIEESGVVGRIVARETVGGRTVTVHAIPSSGRSYAVLGADPGRLVLPDGSDHDCADGTEQPTGVDCDPEMAARTEYLQTTLSVDGETYVVETTCSPV